MSRLPPEVDICNDNGSSPSRRDFLRWSVGGMTVLLLMPTGCEGNDRHFYEASGRPPHAKAVPNDGTPVIWVEAGVCTGCGCALLGSDTPPSETLVRDIVLPFQETFMERFGARAIDQALELLGSKYILVVDGAIPVGEASRMTMVGTGSDASERSAAELLLALAPGAAQVIALGTCASFGGIPGAAPGTGRYVSLAEVIGSRPIRIPGCPPNPSWISSVLSAALRGDSLDLDELGRPRAFFAKTVHDRCPRRESYDKQDFARAPGDPSRCLFKVGCKGMMARGDCPSRPWQGRSYCIKANHPCIGCTAPGFPDARRTVDGRDVGIEGNAAAPFNRELEVPK